MQVSIMAEDTNGGQAPQSVSLSDAEKRQQREERFQEYVTYMGHIHHYLRTGCYQTGVDTKTKKAIRKATSKGQYTHAGKFFDLWIKKTVFSLF